MRLWWIVIISALTLMLCSSSARAGMKERQQQREVTITEELRKQNPEAVVLFTDGTLAQAAGYNQRALSLFEKVNEAVPDFTPALRRRAFALAALGRRAEGIVLARRAVSLESSPDNRINLALVLAFADKGALDPAAVTEALTLGKEVVRETPDDIDNQLLYCHITGATGSFGELQVCAARLVRLAPDEPESYVFATYSALSRGDRAEARANMDKAKALGLDAAASARLEESFAMSEPLLFVWGRRLLVVVAIWLTGLAILFGLGSILSKRTLALSERLASSRESVDAESLGLRSFYRALLNVAGAYYYASLPLVLVLSILVGGGVILGFFWIGHIPLYFIAIALSIVAYTIKSVIKSLLIRRNSEDPGLAVDLRKHTKLAAVLEEVADRVGTRVVDEVFLTPHADIAVTEHGGFFRQLRGTSERRLILGVGVLEGMKLQPFKAILAHEYGHFSNRDTAGGGVALLVRSSLLHTAVGLAQSGAAGWYNPAWLFVVSFQKIFLRISQGASRLQEVLADRIAASAYGPEAFATGLQHVIRRDIEGLAHFKATVREVVVQSRPLPNLYRYELTEQPDAEEIEADVKKAFSNEPSPYDSHPKPADRIRWIRKLQTSLPPDDDDAADAWDLFAGREYVERRVTEEVRAVIERAGGGHVPAEVVPDVEKRPSAAEAMPQTIPTVPDDDKGVGVSGAKPLTMGDD